MQAENCQKLWLRRYKEGGMRSNILAYHAPEPKAIRELPPKARLQILSSVN